MTDKPTPTDAATPECLTCSDHGAVGNSGFDYKTAADFLSGKTVSDEALRKFVAASRGAHDARAALHARMLSLQGELASREAEIALLKRSLLDAEADAAAPQHSTTPQAADSVPAVSDLPPLPAPDLRDVGTKPQEIKEFLKGYATEYARTAIAARAQADSVAAVHWTQPTTVAQRLADAAGMGDLLVTAAPAAVAGPSEAVAYLDIGTGGYLDLGTNLADEALSRLPKGRHALVIAGAYGIDGYTAASTPQSAPPPQEAPAGVLEDAARWHWMAGYIVGTRTDLDDDLIASATVDELRKLVDADLAASKQGAPNDR